MNAVDTWEPHQHRKLSLLSCVLCVVGWGFTRPCT